jgi:14-3-3 protein
MANHSHLLLSALEKKMTTELTTLSRQWAASDEPPDFSLWMASSEVDQKFLGHFAKHTSLENPYLSSMLYRVLGLSVILSKKLLRARKLRRLDPTRDTRSVQQLYHHILWLSREGLVMIEQYILPMVGHYVELKVLAYKLRGSFYHIFVLFHNKPSINQASGPFPLFPEPLSPKAQSGKSKATNRESMTRSPPRRRSPTNNGGPVGGGQPGLPPPPPIASNSGEFILPSLDYIPTATSCFITASNLAESLLPGSHPVRLSVKLEYVAYLYDCLHEKEQSRRLAKRTIADVYSAQEGMDDESFEDAAEMVGLLGKMMKRGLGAGGSGSASTPGDMAGGSESQGSRSTPRTAEMNHVTPLRPRLESKVTPPRGSDGLPMAVPSPGMTNPI